MPTMPGSGSAPAPAWSSSIRRWSMKAPGSPGGSPPASPQRLKREGIVEHRRAVGTEPPSASASQHHAFAARVVAAVDRAVADQHAVDARSPRPDRASGRSRARAAPRAPRARTWSPRPGSWRRARRGSAARSPPASAGPSRSPRPATWRHKRGSHCRPAEPIAPANRPSRVSRIVGVIDERGRLPGATALATGRPCASTGLNEKSVIWLLRKKPSTIRPDAEDRFDGGRHRNDVAVRIADDEMRGAGRLQRAVRRRRAAPARDRRRPAAVRRSGRSAARATAT